MLSITKRRLWIIPIAALSAVIVGVLVFNNPFPQFAPGGGEGSAGRNDGQNGTGITSNRKPPGRRRSAGRTRQDTDDLRDLFSKDLSAARQLARRYLTEGRQQIDKQKDIKHLRAAKWQEKVIRYQYGYAASWARLETTRIYRLGKVDPAFETAAWKPLLECAQHSDKSYAALLSVYKQQRERLVANPDLPALSVLPKGHRSPTKAYEYLSRQAIAHWPGYRSLLYVQLAELAKIARRPDLLKQVFTANQGRLRYKVPSPGKPREWITRDFKSPAAFLAYRHPFESQYGETPWIVPPPPPPPLPDVAVTKEEQRKIRKLVDNFWAARVRRDLKAFLALFDGDRRRLKPLFEDEMAVYRELSYDMTRATFKFSRARSGDPVKVRVQNVMIERIVGRKGYKGRHRYKGPVGNLMDVVFINGEPKIQVRLPISKGTAK